MTGDLDGASSTLLEVIQVVGREVRQRPGGVDNVRQLLYQTARNFSGNTWQKIPVELIETEYSGVNKQSQLYELEMLVNEFANKQREALLLKFRYGFTASEIASISKVPLPVIQDLINTGVLKIRQANGSFEMTAMKQLPLFQVKDIDAMSTMALSEIIPLDRASRFRWLKTLVWLGLIVSLVLYYVSYG